jgi:hypothetical protein
MNNKLLRKLSGIAIIIITALIGFQTLKAEVPNPPRDFAGESYGKNYIIFQWVYNEEDINFNLYIAKGKTDDMSKFKKVEYNLEQLFFENGMYYLYFEENDMGGHSYYLTAYNDDGESERTKIVFIEPFKEQEMIWFIDSPQVTNIKKGETFKYDFNAETNVEDAEIVYSIIKKESDGGSIDSKTGEFEFTPTSGGNYRFTIKAEVKNKPQVSLIMNFALRVNKCDVGASISGKVTGEANSPLNFGDVYLLVAGDWEQGVPYGYTSIVDGNYKFENVDEGEYYLYFTAYGEKRDSSIVYRPEFYNDAQNMEDAEIIKVECANEYSFSAQLVEEDFKQYEITITSEPPKSAKIGDEISYQVTYTTELENPEPLFSLYTNAEGAKIDEATGLMTWKPVTNGNYYFTVYVYLKNKNCQPGMQDFTISIRECEVGATISGTVINESDEPIKFGMATLYSAVNNDPKFGGVNLQVEITDGAYKFENVDKGKYYLYFAGGYDGRKRGNDSLPNYMGQWYDNANNPDDAKIIEVNCADEYTANAKLKENPHNKFKLKIVSEPTKSMKIGETWTYEIKAETDIENPEFVYVLYSPVEGPTIDQTTGVVTWTPTVNGNYQFQIGVYTKEFGPDFSAYQEFILKVNECDIPAKINITITNQDGETIPNTLVYIMQATDNPNEKYGFNVIWYGFVTDGQATIDGLDKGQYYIYAQAFTNDSTYETANYYPWWYNAKYDYEKADILELNCADTKEITAILERIPEPTQYIVSGTVLDKETQEGIEDIYIGFMGTEANTGITQYYETYTDKEGKYSIELPDNFTYIAFAGLFKFKNDNVEILTYIPQLYDGVTDYSEATIITLTSNRDDINFNLSKLSQYENSLTGTLKGEDDELIQKGFVVAYLVECENDAEKFMLYSGTSCQVNEDGQFKIKNLIPGKYVIYGSDDNRKTYAPGYYKENDLAVINWEEATNVTVAAEGESGSYEVVLPFKNKGLAGNGRISGAVSRGKKMKITNDLTSSDPINGANVYLIDVNGNIVKTMNTDANGSFTMDGIGVGDYLLVADKIGLTSSTEMVFIEEGNEDVNRVIELEEKITGVEDNNLSGLKVFPNPAKTQTTLEYIGTSGNTEITIINSIGEDVKTINTTSITGTNVLNIDISSFTAGSYFIRINNNGTTQIQPIIVNK